MSTTPEALRLAELLGTNFWEGKQGREVWDLAAAELRRLAEVEEERDALLELRQACWAAQAAIEKVGAERDQLRAEVEELRGLKPEIPHRPTHNNDASYQHPALPRYGLRWNGPGQPVSVPMADGYWTPFHMALEALEAQQADAERYRAIRDSKAGEYAICEWIEGEDGEGFYQDMRAPELVDAAVDEARKG